jgi:UDP-GlcNAc3NAcA epimerase
MKICTIVGARPQFIKASMLSMVFLEKKINEIIIHTGQHFDENMSSIFFDEMKIPKPKYFLNINSMSHSAMTGNMLIALEPILIEEKPDLVLVYGDTNSTLAAALAARKLNIKIAHVEAGLRNFDMTIPEDVNRILTDRVSDFLFVPSEKGIENLINEGFDSFPCHVVKTGDLLADTVNIFGNIDKKETFENLGIDLKNEFILCTVHRQETTIPENLTYVIEALNTLAKNGHNIIFPIHPRTKKVSELLSTIWHENIQLTDPLGYGEMINLVKLSKCIITDSGGLQKESYLCKKKSLLLMEYTPWEELVDNKFSVTTALQTEVILKNFIKLESFKPDFSINLYGDGNARYEIVNYLIENINSKK